MDVGRYCKPKFVKTKVVCFAFYHHLHHFPISNNISFQNLKINFQRCRQVSCHGAQNTVFLCLTELNISERKNISFQNMEYFFSKLCSMTISVPFIFLKIFLSSLGGRKTLPSYPLILRRHVFKNVHNYKHNRAVLLEEVLTEISIPIH